MNDGMKQAFLDKTVAQVDEWKAKVDVVKARINQNKADVRLEYHTKLENWQEKETVLNQKIAELRVAGEDGYDVLKQGVQKVWNEMGRIINSIEDNKE